MPYLLNDTSSVSQFRSVLGTNYSLCKFVFIFLLIVPLSTSFIALDVSAQIINGPQRVDPSGNPTKCGVYFPDRPKVDFFTLICPNDTHVDQHTFTCKVEWTSSFSANVGVEWGPIKIGIEGTLGKTIGQEISRTLSYNYGPSPLVSRDYSIWPVYAKLKFWGTDANGRAFTVYVFVPEGTWTTVKKRPPYCPSLQTSNARDNLESYRDGLGPGDLRDYCDSALVAIDLALISQFQDVATHLHLASGFLIDAVNLFGGDEPTLNSVLALSSSTLDIGTQQLLDFITGGDPSTGGAYSDPEFVPEILSASLADSVLGLARDTLNNLMLGIDRFSSVLPLYQEAVDLILVAQEEHNTFHRASICPLGGGTGSIPADLDLCGIIPTLSEWGLIIFGVVLLGFITWVFLRRRKGVTVRI